MKQDETKEMSEMIAIIGMSCRLPGVDTIDQYREKLCNGDNLISYFSDDELLEAGVGRNTIALENYVKANSRLAEVEYFDAQFFGLTPREAEILDPQQRILLECAYHALEQAGYATAADQGDIGVFVSTTNSAYAENISSRRDIIEDLGLMTVSMSNERDFVASQLAYRLNFTGPAVNICTACSSSLVAVHHAVNALLNYECDMALAGGATVRARQNEGYLFQKGGILSPDGCCRTFSADAEGTVDGSGGALILLKRLEDAIADGDRIDAVISGSAVNNDGSNKAGFATPGLAGQARVVREAIVAAGVDKRDIGYIEAHGSGSPMSDSIEVSALNEVFKDDISGELAWNCPIGSVKTNLGNLNAAAGIAALIKAVLSVKYGKIFPTLHFDQNHTDIKFEQMPFYVETKLADWPRNRKKRIAGVSSFGLSGTNAHVIVEQAPDIPRSVHAAAAYLFLFSARDPQALKDNLTLFRKYLAQKVVSNDELPIAGDIAYTLSQRPAHEYRLAFVCHSLNDLEEAIDRKLANHAFNNLTDNDGRNAVWHVVDDNRDISLGYFSEAAWKSWLEAIALTWSTGADIRIDNLYSSMTFTKVDLPSYCFQKKRYWVDRAPDSPSNPEQGIYHFLPCDWQDDQLDNVAVNISRLVYGDQSGFDIDAIFGNSSVVAMQDPESEERVRQHEEIRERLFTDEAHPTVEYLPTLAVSRLDLRQLIDIQYDLYRLCVNLSTGDNKGVLATLRIYLDLSASESKKCHGIELVQTHVKALRQQFEGIHICAVELPERLDQKKLANLVNYLDKDIISREAAYRYCGSNLWVGRLPPAVDKHTATAELDVDNICQKVKQIYKSLIGVKSVADTDNFFLLGGNSITAAQLAALLEKEYGVPLDIKTVFEYPEVNELSHRVLGLLGDKPEREDSLNKLLEEIEAMDDEASAELLYRLI